MAGGQLRLRFQHGEVVVELEGDAPSVRAELDTLLAEGYGRLLDFFGPAATPTVTEQTNGQPAFERLANPARTLSYAVDRLRLPTPATPYAMDLDGDGVAENRFGALVAALSDDLALDAQAVLDEALAETSAVLFRISTAEHDLTIDQRADLSVTTGSATEPDRAAFEIDTIEPPATYPGMLRGGRFISDEPPRGSHVPAVPLSLPIFPAARASILAVRAPRIAFALAADGTYLSDGQLNGAVGRSQWAGPLAAQLTAMIAADPQSPARNFDTGGCINPDGSQAQAGDGIIHICEVLRNQLFRTLAQPDVHLFDSAGHYEPDAAGARDSMSFGVGFTAAPASF